MGNQAPFMTRKLRKKTYTRNKSSEIPTKENENLYKNKETNVLPLGGNVSKNTFTT